MNAAMKSLVDACIPLPPGHVHMQGRLGQALGKSCANRLKKIDYPHLVDGFRHRDETDGRWRCEFWGKIVRSAINTWRGTGDEDLLAQIRLTVDDLLSTQTADGCISSYPAELQTKDWDVWGRKYVLLALIRYCNEVTASPVIIHAMSRLLDHLMTQIGPQIQQITACGWHDGMAASSLLDPVARLSAITGEPRHLAFAKWIAAQGGTARTSGDIFAAARQGVRPADIGNAKAYEMMSCFEGLAALYRQTGDVSQRDAVLALHRQVRAHEIFVTGVGGLRDEWGEYWHQGRHNQVRCDCGGIGETCVTTTWLKLCSEALLLTGDPTIVDDMDRALSNGILGAMTPDGTWWMHVNPTPLAGASSRIRAGDQLPGFGEDCCVANGPEGLALAPWLAVMRGPAGPMISLYEDMTAKIPLSSGECMQLKISADLPRSPMVDVTVIGTGETTISLRIPQWSEHTRLWIGDDLQPAPQAGTWAIIHRRWLNGDRIRLEFDLHPRYERAAGDPSRVAVLIGALVLAQDSRLGPVDAPLMVGSGDHGRLDMRVVPSPDPAIHLVVECADGTRLCDYASAGNQFQPSNTLCVWIPTNLAVS